VGHQLIALHLVPERERAHNLQKARIYILASDLEATTRAWGIALRSLTRANRLAARIVLARKGFQKKALEPILDLVLLETQAEQILNVVKAGCVSTNIFLRRLQNFCVGLDWFPQPVV